MPKAFSLDRRKKLYLKDAGAKGYGVFCSEKIRKGEILEETPAIIMNDKDAALIEKTFLDNYVFQIGAISKKMKKSCKVRNPNVSSAVVMGILSFCNHDAKPNAEILWEERNDLLFYMLRATREIPKDTEICTTYGRGWFRDR